ncbi:MATE family efflux transporter [Corallincola luteus]|uniref:MATE family efflux transporter n=1 Tax=Corallincola luteus TaxID=1775177 RepID=A0ABY2AN46_9GAMM|nr:MATE family efflux transporter [Corallincola luteus]TCI04616.1 MATE family efflux transporter [Corallincola luteus]
MYPNIKHALSNTPNSFYKKLFALAMPISMQLILASSLSLIDVLMVSSLGSAEVAAVGLANRFFFVVILMISGVATGASILAAQYVGKGDMAGVRRVLSLGLSVSLLVTLPISLAAVFIPDVIMGLFSNDPEVIAIGAQFLNITAPFHMLMATVSIFAAVLRANSQSMLPMVVGFIAVVTNTALNYLLIFGHFSMPALGVEGAAIATTISKCVECVVMLGTVYIGGSAIRVNLATFFSSFKMDEIRRFMKQSLPLVFNEFIWALGVFSFTIIYAHMGTEAIAAITLLSPIEAISIELFIGFTSAASIIIANRLGADEFHDAKREAWVLTTLITLGCIAYGLLLVGFSDLILSIYSDVNENVLAIAADVFIVIAATLWLRLFNVVTCVSILRSGGDVKFTLYVDMVVIWLIVLPLTAVAGLIYHIPVQWVFAIALGAEALIKAPIYSLRIKTLVWLKNLVKDQKKPTVEPA